MYKIKKAAGAILCKLGIHRPSTFQFLVVDYCHPSRRKRRCMYYVCERCGKTLGPVTAGKAGRV